MSDESYVVTDPSLLTEMLSPNETDSKKAEDIILNEIGELNVVIKETILPSKKLSTQEMNSTAILPTELKGDEVLSNSIGFDHVDRINKKSELASFTDTSLLTEILSPNETDSKKAEDIILNEIGELNAVTKETILSSEKLSTQEINSAAILPTELIGGEVGCGRINQTPELVPEHSYISFVDSPKLGHETIVKLQNDSEYANQINPNMGNIYLPILLSEITSETNKRSIASEYECENEYEVITTAQNTITTRQITQSSINVPVQTSARYMNNRIVIIGVTVGILLTIISVTVLALLVKTTKQVMTKSTASSYANYTMATPRGNSLILTESTASSYANYTMATPRGNSLILTESTISNGKKYKIERPGSVKMYSQSNIPVSKFIGITARSRPALIPFSLTAINLDLSNVIINSGVNKPIAGKITCPMDGVYFLSVSMMNNGNKLDWITPHVWKNSKKFITMGMGSYTKDYAADEHAFIICKQGVAITVRYNYLGIPGLRWTSKASITLMLMAPSVESMIGFYGRQYYDKQFCKLKREIKFVEYLATFNHTLFKVNKFTCPVKGIYLVMASYVTQQNQATVTVVNNRQPILSLAFTQTAYTGIFHEDLYSSASNIVIVNCLAKDKLLVKTVGPKRCNVNHKARIMFSAILLHRDGNETFVGVSAWKKSVQEYRLNDAITFDSVLLNEGGYFDTSTSKFSCPHNGFYYTALTVRKEKGYPVRLSLQLENESVFKIDHLYYDQLYGMMSSSSLLHCKEGEEIYVMGIGDGAVYGSEKLVITTVTIILMHTN